MLIWWWCLEHHGRLYFIVHPHCMKCCSTRTLYPTYTRTHFTDFETIGLCCYSLMPQGPWFDPIGDRTLIYYTRVQNAYQYTWQVLSLVYIRMKKVKYISGQYILQGNTSFLLFYEGRVVFIRLKIVNEFLWENVRRNEFESTQGVIRIRKWKDRQHNSQKKRDKRTNNDLQSIHTKPKIT